MSLERRFERLASSYWFVPALMTVAAMLLAALVVYIDLVSGRGWKRFAPWLLAVQPDGARTLLSTIAGSMITVAGVTFSITISAVVHASSQYGPRLLGRFMRDRGNQVSLGIFIATFMYCVLLLLSIEAAEDPSLLPEGAIPRPGFVPELGIFVAMLLSTASVGVLIYFIHHAPQSIHVSTVVAELDQSLKARLARAFPRLDDEQASTPDDSSDARNALLEGEVESGAAVESRAAGYVQYVDEARLLQLATNENLVLRLDYRAGDFAGIGDALLYVHRANLDGADLDGTSAEPEGDGARPEIPEALAASLRDCFRLGSDRSEVQDLLLPVDQLVEIAVRALSPGINDPFTAINCLDRLGGALHELAGRRSRRRFRFDAEHCLRIVSRPISFEDFVGAGFEQIKPYAASDALVSLRYVAVLGQVALKARRAEHREAAISQAQRLVRAAGKNLTDDDATEELERRIAVLQRLDGERDNHARLALEHPWLGGSG